MKLNLRATLLIGYAFIVILMGMFAMITGLSFISDTVVTEAKLSVQNDLNAAWIAYNEEKAILQSSVGIISQRDFIRTSLINKSISASNIKNIIWIFWFWQTTEGMSFMHIMIIPIIILFQNQL